MQFRKAQTTNVDEENPYWMSFSDIMSALLAKVRIARAEIELFSRYSFKTSIQPV